MKALLALMATIAAVLLLADSGVAYKASGPRWSSGTVTMHLQQGSSSGTLIDGSRDWNAVTDGALTTWNSYLNGLTLRGSRDSSAAIGRTNGVNNVIWGDDIYGDPFDETTVAIALQRYQVSNSRFTEVDVIFNRKFGWNSYRGNERTASGGGTLIDLRRVALHEFGHAVGLDHPDDYGQSVSAIMNSLIGNTDTLQSDDTNGVQSIYGTVTVAPTVTDTLAAGGRLTLNQTLVSTNRRYRLLYQADGNLVLYDDIDRTAPWAANTGGASPGHLTLQGDGNLVVYDAQGTVRFATNTAGNPNARLVLQNDGNLVIYRSNGQPAWDRSMGVSSPTPTPAPSPSPVPSPSPAPGGTTTITITSTGVSPRAVTVSQGGRVTFVNNDTRAHDMASNPHPEHTDCPELNSVGFLTPGQSRASGNLNTRRTCGFHDHNRDTDTSLQGTITIQ